jgi:hypothetical protein
MVREEDNECCFVLKPQVQQNASHRQINNSEKKELQRRRTENQENKKEEESRAPLAHDIAVPTLAAPFPAPMSLQVSLPHATYYLPKHNLQQADLTGSK